MPAVSPFVSSVLTIYGALTSGSGDEHPPGSQDLGLDPGQDKEASIVDGQLKIAASLDLPPADEPLVDG